MHNFFLSLTLQVGTKIAVYNRTFLRLGVKTPHSKKDHPEHPINPLSPNINIQILLTDLHTISYSIGWVNLLKEYSNVPLVIILFYSQTVSLDYVFDIVRRNLKLVTLGIR